MNRTTHITRRRRGMFLTACLLVWVGGLIATHIPAVHMPRSGVSDKLLHMAGYFVLAGAFWLTLWVYDVDGPKRVAFVFFAMLAYAAFDEITQPLVGRDASLGDWLADVGGAALAIIASELLLLMRRKVAWPSRP